MTGKAGTDDRDRRGRFRKGESGNPNGRPRRRNSGHSETSASAFDIVIDKSFPVMRNGIERQLTAEEALQLKTFEEAIKGSRPARREILKMIAKREKWLAARHKPSPPAVTWRTEFEADNADDALLILGIAALDPDHRDDPRFERRQLLLEPWAVQAALSRRRGGTQLNDKDIADIKRCTRLADTIRWPRGPRA